MRRIMTCFMVLVMIFSMTASGYAAGGATVSYIHEDTQFFVFMEDDLGSFASTTIGLDVELFADFTYSSSDSNARYYDDERYGISVRSVNSPYYTNQLSYNLGTMKVYTTQGNVVICTRDYNPQYWVPSDNSHTGWAAERGKIHFPWLLQILPWLRDKRRFREVRYSQSRFLPRSVGFAPRRRRCGGG